MEIHRVCFYCSCHQCSSTNNHEEGETYHERQKIAYSIRITHIGKRIDEQRIREDIRELDVFRANHQQLFIFDEMSVTWRPIARNNEVTTIRGLFCEEDQSRLSTDLVKRLADWLRNHPSLEVYFSSKRDPDLVSMKDNMYNVKTKEIRKRVKEDYQTNFLDANYIPKEERSSLETSKFDGFVESIFALENVPQKLKLLLQIIGCVIACAYYIKKAFFLIGPANCGKSVILRFLQKVLGDEMFSSIPLNKLSDNFYQAELSGKSANLSGEIPVERISASAYDTFKGLVGGDTMTADRKRKDPFKFVYKGTLVFAGNALPTFKSIDGSDALISRMTLLVFNTSIKAEDQDRDMDEKLFRERNLIVSLALDELHELIKSGFKFTYGDDELQMLSQYKESVNTVQAFIDHACELEEESRMYICDVYDSYVRFCELIAEQPDKREEFKKKIVMHPHIQLGGKLRVNKQSPKACFLGIKSIHLMEFNEYDNMQDTEMYDQKGGE